MWIHGCIKWAAIVTVGSLLFAGILVGSYGIWWSWGYKTWNDEAIPTYARIEAIEIVNSTCSYKCNRYCFGICTKCNTTCSDVFLNVTYNRHHQHYQYLTDVINYTILLEQLANCCSIGKDIRIYYNKDNPHDINTQLHSMLIFWVIILFTLAIMIICIIFIIFVYRRETQIFDYQSLYNDPLRDEYPESLDFPRVIDTIYSDHEPVALNY